MAAELAPARSGRHTSVPGGGTTHLPARRHRPRAPPLPSQGPVTSLVWAQHGFRLVAAEGGSPYLLQELRFAHTLAGDHRAVLRRRWTGALAPESELPPWLDAGEDQGAHALLVGGHGLVGGVWRWCRPSPGDQRCGQEHDPKRPLRIPRHVIMPWTRASASSDHPNPVSPGRGPTPPGQALHGRWQQGPGRWATTRACPGAPPCTGGVPRGRLPPGALSWGVEGVPESRSARTRV